MKLPIALAVALLGCAAPKPPAEAAHEPGPPAVVTPAAPTETPRVDAAAPDPGPPPPPACIPKELRAEGRIFAARIDAKENFDFCIRKGIGSEAPTRCLELSFADKSFKGLGDVWPGMSFFTIIEGETGPSVSARLADNAGTLDVCSGDDCVSLRVHAPKPGAFDEVYAMLPVTAVPGTPRVVVARVQETWPKNGPSSSEIFLDAVDVKRKAKISSTRVAKDEWPVELISLGNKALLKSCTRDSQHCNARVVDPKTLTVTKLKLDLAREEPRGADAGSFVQRTTKGETLLIDRSGSTALWLNADGAVSKRLELGPPAAESEPARAGRRNAREVVVLRAGPNAGTVTLIGLEDGSVTRFDAPVCP